MAITTINNSLINAQTLNLKPIGFSPGLLKVGQLLTINIQPISASQAQVTLANQTLVATTKQPINESGDITVKVKQTVPDLQLVIVKPNNKNSSTSLLQQTAQNAYRQFIPTQTPLPQVFQQINALQSLPASLIGPTQQLLDQMQKIRLTNDGGSLKQKISDSGLFLESKIKNSANSNGPELKNDLKAQILQLQKQVATLHQQSSSSTLNKLSGLLSQALSRLTVQQVQLFENPNITPLELPSEKQNSIQNDLIEIRKEQKENQKSWEAYIDLKLTLGTMSTKLKLYEDRPLECYIWCESKELEQQVQMKLPQLEQLFKANQIDINPIQISAKKPEPNSQSSKVALIDIKV